MKPYFFLPLCAVVPGAIVWLPLCLLVNECSPWAWTSWFVAIGALAFMAAFVGWHIEKEKRVLREWLRLNGRGQ